MKLAILCLLWSLGLPDGHDAGTLGAAHYECAPDVTGDDLPDIGPQVGEYDDAALMAAIDRHNAAYSARYGTQVTAAIHDPE